MRSRWWWLIVLTLFVWLCAVVVLIWSGHPRGAEVIAAVRERTEIWGEALQALRVSPWFGIGLDYFRHSGYSPVFVFPDKIVGNPHAHNIFLQTALDVGLIGLASYVAIVAFVLRRAWEIVTARTGDEWVRYIGFGAALSIASVHLYGLLDAVALGAKVGLFQWLACGLVLAAWRLDRQGRSSSVG
jgi:putative inorganic carbon (HCO3(-)) transporter